MKWVRLLKKRHKSYKDLIVRVNFSKKFASVNLGNIGVSLVKTPPTPTTRRLLAKLYHSENT